MNVKKDDLEENLNVADTGSETYEAGETVDDKETAAESSGEDTVGDNGLAVKLEEVKAELEAKTTQCDEYLNKLQRTAAEFDNYKKRTLREKEALYADAASDIISTFLPVVDSIEKALQACADEENFQTLKDGIELIGRQFKDIFKNIGVEEIKTLDGNFDPQYHDAVMHVEDESTGQNTIVEEFRKGYIYKDRVIRHSMVKVAN